jgi:hypothetical protein
MVHKPLSMIEFGAPFANCYRRCFYYAFPTRMMSRIRRHGAIPLLSWSSASIPPLVRQPKFRLADVIEGHFDPFIRQFARDARRWGHPFLLRFDWEMNGNWFPWGEAANGNRPGQYVQAWRHVHDIFAAQGASNVNWVWCPNIDPNNAWRSMSELYPGNAYVDWTCLDGYNWGSTGPGSPGALRGGWTSFRTLFSISYQRVVDTIAPNKPMLLGEVASATSGGSRSAWIRNMLGELPGEFPLIRGIAWLQQVYASWDFRIHPRTASASAFAASIRGRRYASNLFCDVGGASIFDPALAGPLRSCAF